MSITEFSPLRLCRHMGRRQQLACLVVYTLIFCLIALGLLNRKFPGYLGGSGSPQLKAVSKKDDDPGQLSLRRVWSDAREEETTLRIEANFIYASNGSGNHVGSGNLSSRNLGVRTEKSVYQIPPGGKTDHGVGFEGGDVKKENIVPLDKNSSSSSSKLIQNSDVPVKGLDVHIVRQDKGARTGESVADENAALAAERGEKERTIFRPKPLTVQYYHSVLDNEPFTSRYNTCAIVSSSGQLLGKRAGAEIDSADAVIRMNAAPVKGFEPDVGKRTTLRVLCFISSQQLTSQAESILRGVGAPKMVLFWGLEAPQSKRKAQAIPKVTALQRRFMDITFFSHRHTGELAANALFERETGVNREDTNSWLSTGWFTIMTALDICQEVRIYGMVPDDHCTYHDNDRVKYHYFQTGSNPSECSYYKAHEATPRGGHRFMTEKAIFARWAQSYNLTFHHPTWKRSETEVAKKLDTPFAKLLKLKGLKYFQNRGQIKRGKNTENTTAIILFAVTVIGLPAFFIVLCVFVPHCVDEEAASEQDTFHRRQHRYRRL